MSAPRYVALPLAGAVYMRIRSTRALWHIVDANNETSGPLCRKAAPSSILRDATQEYAPKYATCNACKRQLKRLTATSTAKEA